MARIRYLKKAPITEAVLDFRTQLPEGVTIESLEAAVNRLSSDYPQIEKIWRVESSFRFSSDAAGTAASSSRRINGYSLSSPDGKQVIQFRLDGFTFSRLAPYTSWEKTEPEAIRLWEIYREVATPEVLFRIAVRYINQIPLPAPNTEMADILVSPPQVPSELPQQFTTFLTRVVVPLEKKTHVSITHAYNVPPATSGNTVLLDIDVVRTEELDPEPASLRPIFDELREFKNRAFFGSLTEESVEKFE